MSDDFALKNQYDAWGRRIRAAVKHPGHYQKSHGNRYGADGKQTSGVGVSSPALMEVSAQNARAESVKLGPKETIQALPDDQFEAVHRWMSDHKGVDAALRGDPDATDLDKKHAELLKKATAENALSQDREVYRTFTIPEEVVGDAVSRGGYALPGATIPAYEGLTSTSDSFEKASKFYEFERFWPEGEQQFRAVIELPKGTPALELPADAVAERAGLERDAKQKGFLGAHYGVRGEGGIWDEGEVLLGPGIEFEVVGMDKAAFETTGVKESVVRLRAILPEGS